MIYLDNGATTLHKPPQVAAAVVRAMEQCANPGRGGHAPAMKAAQTVFRTRETAGRLFGCNPEQVVFTSNCTHGLNIAIRSLVKPGDRVVVSGFEHNGVVRPMYALGAEVTVAGRKLFDWEDTLSDWERALKQKPKAAVFTHVSNVFGYILPVMELAGMCRERGIPFVVDAAQSAGCLEVNLEKLGADFIAMPGHKGLLGPQGTGLLLCRDGAEPIFYGGTGGDSRSREMPPFLPERLEGGTVNVPGIAGLGEGLRWLERMGVATVFRREHQQLVRAAEGLEKMGFRVFRGQNQAGTLSLVPDMDCEDAADHFARRGIALRAGLHCAPLAHESAGTLESGTLRISFGWDASDDQTRGLLRAASKLIPGKY